MLSLQPDTHNQVFRQLGTMPGHIAGEDGVVLVVVIDEVMTVVELYTCEVLGVVVSFEEVVMEELGTL